MRAVVQHLRALPTPRVEFSSLHETLLIAAVATVLVIRTQLWLTNYPQLGGGGLHIAHLLWGGLFMLLAIGLLLTLLPDDVERRILLAQVEQAINRVAEFLNHRIGHRDSLGNVRLIRRECSHRRACR